MPKLYTVEDDYHDSRLDKWFKNEKIDLSIDLTNLSGQEIHKYICEIYNFI